MMLRINWKHEIWMIGIILAMFVYAIAAWQSVPESFPVHWNLQGEVDRYGGRFEGMLMCPLIALAIYLLLLVIPMIDPGKANYPSFAKSFYYIRWLTLILIVAIYIATQLFVFGFPVDIGLVVGVSVGAMFLLLGNMMGKIRPNWFVGIRTPWTLSSHVSWNKTHRLGGWLFMLLGILMIVLGFVKSSIVLYLFLAALFVSITTLVIYSYFVWKSDPNKSSPSDVAPASSEDLKGKS